jgi:hypothetical protein
MCLGDGIFVGVEWFYDFVNNLPFHDFFKIFKE